VVDGCPAPSAAVARRRRVTTEEEADARDARQRGSKPCATGAGPSAAHATRGTIRRNCWRIRCDGQVDARVREPRRRCGHCTTCALACTGMHNQCSRPLEPTRLARQPDRSRYSRPMAAPPATFSVTTAGLIVLCAVAASVLVSSIVFGSRKRGPDTFAAPEPLGSATRSEPVRGGGAGSEPSPSEEYLLDLSEPGAAAERAK
jgi:hypothetical protein